jgi:ABC-type transporter Mla subunit MlaD
MKFNESFENQPSPEMDPEILLLTERIKNFGRRITEELSGLEKTDLKLVKALLSHKQLKKMNSDLNEKYDNLSERSEELIDSVNADKPEIREERKEIANEINKIMEAQQELEKILINHEDLESVIKMADKEKLDRAEEIANKLLEDLNNTIKPRTDLN